MRKGSNGKCCGDQIHETDDKSDRGRIEERLYGLTLPRGFGFRLYLRIEVGGRVSRLPAAL